MATPKRLHGKFNPRQLRDLDAMEDNLDAWLQRTPKGDSGEIFLSESRFDEFFPSGFTQEMEEELLFRFRVASWAVTRMSGNIVFS